MFDPFNDFEKSGYLRNVRKDKDQAVIKTFEHNLFRANLSEALQFLKSKKILAYKEFLQVHQILFSSYYPWAGQDRSVTMPDRAVIKGKVHFCHPLDSKRAVECGLILGQKKSEMEKRPGEVMGLFAYGHPFLDGNGRTMLLFHLELTHRAGYSISWADTKKVEYLTALSQEIEKPGQGILDSYLTQFKGPLIDRSNWAQSLLSMKGLDGLDEGNQIDGSLSDPIVAERYQDFEKRRDYAYAAINVNSSDSESEVCSDCKNVPCTCGGDGRSGTSQPRG
jgi:cell filamentation protein